MGPKLVKCCRPEQMGTKDFGKVVKRLQTPEEGRVPANEAGRKEKNYEKGVSRGCETISKSKVSWHEKTSGSWKNNEEESCLMKKVML